MSRLSASSVSLRLAIALALGLGLAACNKDKPADTTAPAATAPAGPTAAEAAAAQAAQQQAAALNALSVDELKKRGSQALREQRLYAPAGDNAMEYYLTLRKKSEKPDASAESALIDLTPYAVIAAEQALGREDFIEAERLRALIADADAQAPALPRITDAIAKGKANVANRATQEATRAADLAKAAEDAKAKAAAAAATAATTTTAPKPTTAAPAPTPSAPPPAPERATPVVTAPSAPSPSAPAPSRNTGGGGLVPISTPQPAYPPEAQRQGKTGEVVVSFTVNADGSVGNVDIVSSKPRGVFDRNVQAAVRRWKFQPTDQQTVTRTFTFQR